MKLPENIIKKKLPNKAHTELLEDFDTYHPS